jgi:hypothetical protein
MSNLIMFVDFDDGRSVELDGAEVTYWPSREAKEPKYVGPVEGLPPEILRTLKEIGVIRVH